MTNQVRTVGILWIVWGAMALLSGIFIVVILMGAGLIAEFESGDTEALGILSIVATCFGGFFLLVSLPNIVVGIGLMKRKEWARILGFVLAALNILSVPLGTALSIYTFFVLLSPDTQAIFKDQKNAQTPPQIKEVD